MQASRCESPLMQTQTKQINTVQDLDDSFILVSDSQDISAILDSIGVYDFERQYVGCLFVEISDGDYSRVYSCERAIPYNDALVWQLR